MSEEWKTEPINTGGIKFSEFIFGLISVLFSLSLSFIIAGFMLFLALLVTVGPFILLFRLLKYLI